MPESALVQYMKDREREELAEQALQQPPTVRKYVFGAGGLGALAGAPAGHFIGKSLGGPKGLGAGVGAVGGFTAGLFAGNSILKRIGRKIADAQNVLLLKPKQREAEIGRRALANFYTPEQYQAMVDAKAH